LLGSAKFEYSPARAEGGRRRKMKNLKAEYPEHEKLQAVKDKSQAIGEFLEWLGHRHRRVWLCDYSSRYDAWFPLVASKEELLAEYFQIGLKALEKEKQAMLRALRERG